jgi:hypothetical protein
MIESSDRILAFTPFYTIKIRLKVRIRDLCYDFVRGAYKHKMSIRPDGYGIL